MKTSSIVERKGGQLVLSGEIAKGGEGEPFTIQTPEDAEDFFGQ